MEAGRQDEREATFKFIKEVHYCPAVWDVSSAASNDTKNKQKLKVVAKGGGFLLIYGFVQTLLFLLRRLIKNKTKTQVASLRECHCTMSAMLRISVL